VVGAGVGFHAVKTERSRLNLLGGIDFNHLSFSTSLVQDSAEAYFGDDYSYKRSASTSMTQGWPSRNATTSTCVTSWY
jgi:hypothetical protein